MAISSLLVNFILFMGIGWFAKKSKVVGNIASKLVVAGLVASLIWILITGLGYLFTPLFFDHAEANIASVASYWWTGHPIYTELMDSHRYSLLYGPWPYVVSGFFQGFGSETILLTKLPGVLNLVLFLAAAALLSSQLQISRFVKVLMVSEMALVVAGFYNYSYWIRPDSYLITYTFLAFFIVERYRDSWFVCCAVAVLAALAANSKAHGLLYFIPVIVYYFELPQTRFEISKLVVGAIVFAIVFFGVFALPGINLNNYLEWLKMAAHHGLQMAEFLKNITLIGSFVLLLGIFGFARDFKFTFMTFCAMGFLASVVGSKAGAGTNHLIPFLPVILWMAMQRYLNLPLADQKRLAYVVGAFAFTLILNGVNRQKRVKSLYTETPIRLEEFNDLKTLLKKYDGPLEMGYTSQDSYLSTLYKPWLVAKGGSLLLEGASLMDLGASDIEVPESTVKALEACEVRRFVFPITGEPWTLESYYEGRKLFSDEFRNVFAAKYKKVEETKFFKIYECL